MRGPHIAPAAGAVLSLAMAITACGSAHARTAAGAPAGASTVRPAVVANCASVPPHRPSVRPGSITLACADAGLGVQKMTWNEWTASAATGQGRLWEKLCRPNCAEGKIATYPVAVTLSAVRSSSSGPWFSRLTVTWKGRRPPGHLPGSFPLMKP